jgi:mRNA interferase RelE/StbE
LNDFYELIYETSVIKNLKNIDPSIRKDIIRWIEKNLENCENPRLKGKSLTANLSGSWRYRFGKYRLLVTLDDAKRTITLIDIGPRKDIYLNK